MPSSEDNARMALALLNTGADACVHEARFRRVLPFVRRNLSSASRHAGRQICFVLGMHTARG